MGLVLFDYDGVLADTLDDLLKFGQAACNQLGVKHTVTKSDLTNLEVMSFASYGKACEVPEKLIDQFVGICLNLFAEQKTPSGIFPGVGKVVRQLANQHFIDIVTTNSSQNVNAFLVKHGLAQLIHAVYGIDSPGSKTQKILLAQTRLPKGRTPEPAFMVGDSLSDIRAAKAARVASIAVTWGHQSVETLMSGQPDYLIHVPNELLGIVNK